MSGSAAPRQRWQTYLSLGLALLTCPCHLPLLLVLLAGTTLGAWLNQYLLPALLAMAGLFVLTLLYSFKTLTRDGRETGAASPPAYSREPTTSRITDVPSP